MTKKRAFKKAATDLRAEADILVGAILARDDARAFKMVEENPALMNTKADWGYPLIAAIMRPEPTETNTTIMQEQIAMVSFFAKHGADFILEDSDISPRDAAIAAYKVAPAAPKAEVNLDVALRAHKKALLGTDPEIKIKRAATAILDLVKQTELSQRREKNAGILQEQRKVEKRHMERKA